MTTVKSYSDKSRFAAMYRSSLKQLVPFAIVASIIFALITTLAFVVEYRDFSYIQDEYSSISTSIAYWQGVYVEDFQAPMLSFVLVAMGIIMALFQNSYMHSKKRIDLYHSIPVRRDTLLATNFLAGLTSIIIPFVGVTALTAILQIIRFGEHIYFKPYISFIILDCLFAVLTFTLVYSFTTFICVNVGTIFDSFALTCVLGFLPMVVYSICAMIWESMIYGAVINFDNVLLLSPFTFIFQRYIYHDYYATQIFENISGLIMVIIGAIILSAVFFGAAILCYKRRKSEMAGQTQSQGIFQTIAKAFTAFCGGALFYAIFSNNDSNFFIWAIAVFAGALLIGTIAELILSRGVRSLVKNLKWLATAAAICCAVLLVSYYDLTGYSRWVPKESSIESVDISYNGRFETLSDNISYKYGNYDIWGNKEFDEKGSLSQPDSIAVITAAHQMAVQNQPDDSTNTEYGDQPTHVYGHIQLSYKMKSGRVISRSYSTLSREAMIKLSELEDKDEFITSKHLFFQITEPGYLSEGETFGFESTTFYRGTSITGTPYNLSDANSQLLMNAIREDMLREPLQDILDPQQSPVGTITMRINILQGNYTDPYTNSRRASVVIGQNYTSTIAVLKSLDIYNSTEPTIEIDRIDFSYNNNTLYKVTAIIPEVNAYEYTYDRSYAYNAPFSDDKKLIAQVLDAGRTQMLTGYSSRNDTVTVRAYSGDMLVNYMMVPASILPESIRQDIYDYNSGKFESPIYDYSETIPAEEIPEVAEEFEESADLGEAA